MLRFFIPENATAINEMIDAINGQIEDFLKMEPLQDLLGILEVDIDTIGQVYNGRLKANGKVVETQELALPKKLEGKREVLYPVIRELGFFDINKPLRKKNNRIIILGGSLTACKERTEYAKKWIDDSTCFIDGLACYRPINPVERSPLADFKCDTEFGAMSESFIHVFNLDKAEVTEEFKGDRNLNSISCIKKYSKDGDSLACRIFAAPSTEPQIRRADTGDTIKFYIRNSDKRNAEDSFLFVTNNRYCNRQFMQIAYSMKEEKYPIHFDVIGCTPDERIIPVERYDPFQFIQDLIGVIDWAYRFREKNLRGENNEEYSGEVTKIWRR
ncbi:hypothetical protein [Butyrivibrio sp. WCE2006]|uniref:hypothetical protein n=1 Tax=Butyrivibrio sp. WCE2006 TaxID=1410611 RepID=UPI0005D295B8|nr:hypothetical protein [Butyrivibrio sp. WCE2006]